MNIDAFIAELVNGNAGGGNPAYAANESERDGNVDDLLFRIDQPSIGISGGTTITSLSPYTAVTDLGSGKVSLAVLVWLGLALFAGWWIVKK
jgi:hypothetical protein